MALTIGQELTPTLELRAVGFTKTAAWDLTVMDATLSGYRVYESGDVRYVEPNAGKPLTPTLTVLAGPGWLPTGTDSNELHYFFGFVVPALTTFDVVRLAGEALLQVSAADVPVLTPAAIGFEVSGPAELDYYFRFVGVAEIWAVEFYGQRYLAVPVSEIDGP